MATHTGRSPHVLRFTSLVVTALLVAFLGWYTNYRWHHRSTSPTDPLLKQVLTVKSTERVDLRGRRISDSDVARLKELPNLK